MSVKKVISYIAAFAIGIVVTVILFTIMLSSAPSDYGMSMDSIEEAVDEKSNSSSSPNPTNSLSYDEVFDKDKIIYEGTVNLDVNDNKKAVSQIKGYIESIEGFIESSYTSNVDSDESNNIYSYLTVRVPSDKFDETIEQIKEFGEETSTDINSTNISSEYKDIESEKESLVIQEERLNKYLKESKKIEDMLVIEAELSKVRTELNRINTSLQNYDRLIQYSTIIINIRETQALSKKVESPFSELTLNIKKAFINSVNVLLQIINYIILLVFRLLPFAIVLIPVAIILKRQLKK